MKRSISIIFLCIIAIGSVRAEVITLPLPELIGPVGRHPNWNVVSIDLGVTFSAIQSVKVQYSGSITPGLGQGDGVECSVYPQYQIPGKIQVFFDHPATGSCITNIGPYNGSFSVLKSLECTYSASWDILLDGQDELITHVTSDLVSICGVTVYPPSATISDASLIVEGTVASMPCDYVVVGDMNDDCKVDQIDFADLGIGWLTSYDIVDLAEMAENWLIDCDLTPGDPVCVPK